MGLPRANGDLMVTPMYVNMQPDRNVTLRGMALFGYPGSGKSTTAAYLQERWGYEKLALAEDLRWTLITMLAAEDMVPASIPFTVQVDDEGEEYKEYDMEAFYEYTQNRETKSQIRPLLRALGGYGRSLDLRWWIDRVLAQMEDLDPAQCVVIEDTRYFNEFDALRENGLLLVRIDGRRDTSVDLDDPSEYDWIHVDPHCILNNEMGGLDNLYMQVDSIIHLYESQWATTVNRSRPRKGRFR